MKFYDINNRRYHCI